MQYIILLFILFFEREKSVSSTLLDRSFSLQKATSSATTSIFVAPHNGNASHDGTPLNRVFFFLITTTIVIIS